MEAPISQRLFLFDFLLVVASYRTPAGLTFVVVANIISSSYIFSQTLFLIENPMQKHILNLWTLKDLYGKKIWLALYKTSTHLGTNISPAVRHFWVEEFPFPKVVYVNYLEGSFWEVT